MPDALIVIDVQNDFCPGGALAVPEGDAVVPVMNAYMKRASSQGMPIFVSRDWHPEQTTHFAAYGGIWPPHCLQNTAGAAFHPGLRIPREAIIASKGMDPTDDGYSNSDAQLPDGSRLLDVLRERGITRVHVGGLATDYCVRATVLDLVHAGLDVRLLTDASRAVEVTLGDGERAIAEMLQAGARSETLTAFPEENRKEGRPL